MASTLELIDPDTGIGVPRWTVPSQTDLASNECAASCPERLDLADAPDSSNHFPDAPPMTAYPGIPASFPTVRDTRTGTPPGPFHRLVPDSRLGESVSHEDEADLPPDEDTLTNIEPPTDTADRDGGDDGVIFPVRLPACQLTQITFTLTVVRFERDRYINVWFDFNRNGQWGEELECVADGRLYPVSEWAVVNHLTQLGPGTYTLTTPAFRSLDPEGQLWLRITLAETVAPAADGRGYEQGYEIGETEDYLLSPLGGNLYE